MKKIISLVITVLLISNLSLTAFADSKEIPPRYSSIVLEQKINSTFPIDSTWDWILLLAQKIDITDLLFNHNYDWKAFFNGELDVADSEELAAILNILKSVVESINIKEIPSDKVQEMLDNKYAEYSVNKILNAIENLLGGDYKDYVDLFKGDYTSLSKVLDSLDVKTIIDDLLQDKSDELNKKLNGHYDLVKDLIDGNYTYLQSFLNKDEKGIEDLKTALGLNLKILMDNLDKDTLLKLMNNKDSKILQFIDKYYDQIVMLVNGDYSNFDFSNYDDLSKILKDLYETVNYKHIESTDDIMEQLLCLDDNTLINFLIKLTDQAYKELPFENKIQIGNITNVINNISNYTQYVILYAGDLNRDEEITLEDVVFLQEYLSDLQQLSNYQDTVADINEDGVINLLDVVLMQEAIADLIQLPSY